MEKGIVKKQSAYEFVMILPVHLFSGDPRSTKLVGRPGSHNCQIHQHCSHLLQKRPLGLLGICPTLFDSGQ